ncbi:Protein STIP1 [Tetrabaena socialis]|uniref:Protein STIP1 n=1 Tax=Tetrabaena socialis TaxID=47790 RepID=A0A2J7ZVE4_9CHLO|nr:Protein STIP1 [Tetrabaena socialis]|eukprot:PNH04208.1 Protein STIP1 [Tetrabaena socialis]
MAWAACRRRLGSSAGVCTYSLTVPSFSFLPCSNRSAALLKLNKVSKALEDAEKCISLRPDWEKGYFRKAGVLEAQDRLLEALDVYQTAARLSADNKELGIKIRALSKLLKIKSTHREDTLEACLAAAIAGSDIPRLAQFGRDMSASAMENLADSGLAFPPSVHFLPGPAAASHEEREEHIQAAHAFSNPDMYTDFVGGMRETAQRLDAAAVIAVVSRSTVAYPQVWEQKGWPLACGKQQGIFVQLEVRSTSGSSARHAWFVPVGTDKTTGRPVPISAQDFAPLPTLFK